MNKQVILSFFLIMNALSFGNSINFSSPCTESEMIEPKETFFILISKLRKPDANRQLIIEQIDKVLGGLSDHIKDIEESSCGDEKIKIVEKLYKLKVDVENVHDIMKFIDDEDYEKAANMIQKIHCIFIMYYLVQKYSISHENLDKMVEVLKIMDDDKAINLLNNAFIHVINEDNIGISNVIVPLMKKHILDNKNKMADDDLLMAKHNMKELVIKIFDGSYDHIIALSEVDVDMADQAIYEIIYNNVSEANYIPAFDKTKAAPSKGFQIYGYRAIFDKLHDLNMQHGLILGKVLILVNNLIESEEIQNNPGALEIANSMLEKGTEFAKNVMTGYSCQDIEQIQSFITGEPERQEEHNEYIVLFNPDHPENTSNYKFIEKEDGDLLMITVDREFQGNHVVFSVIIKNDDYPENIHMKGKIVSKKVIGKIPTSFEEICNMNPTPITKICTPFTKTFTLPMEKHTEHRNQTYESYLNYMKGCNKEQN